MGLYINITVKYKENKYPDTEITFDFGRGNLIAPHAQPLSFDEKDFALILKEPESLLKNVDQWMRANTLVEDDFDLEDCYLSDAVEYENISELPFDAAELITSVSSLSHRIYGRSEVFTSYNYETDEYVYNAM